MANVSVFLTYLTIHYLFTYSYLKRDMEGFLKIWVIYIVEKLQTLQLHYCLFYKVNNRINYSKWMIYRKNLSIYPI